MDASMPGEPTCAEDVLPRSGGRFSADRRSAILIVEDDVELGRVLTAFLRAKGREVRLALNVDEALSLLAADRSVGIILSDIRMPGRSGIDLLAEVRAGWGEAILFVTMTGFADLKDAVRALQLGAYDFLQKPLDFLHVFHVIEKAEELLRLRDAHKRQEERLKSEVERKTSEVRTLFSRLEVAYDEAVHQLAVAAEFKDTETGNHIRRIGEYTRFVAACLGWPERHQRELAQAAPLHDIGKIGVPDAVLLKQGRLDDAEMGVMRRHCDIGARILQGSEQPVMRRAASIAMHHHERWDGSGYPNGTVGAAIPIEARITSLCDVYDALRARRPYKEAMTHSQAVDVILKGDGRTSPAHFDPAILKIVELHGAAFEQIYARFADTHQPSYLSMADAAEGV